MKKAIVIGHACLDITPIFDSNLSGSGIALEPGKLISVGPADIHTGGAVSNTGMAMHRFGANVSLMAKVGNDDFGLIIQNAYKESGINCRLKVSKSDPTSYSIVIARPGIDRTFMHCPGCNDTFTSSDVLSKDFAEASLVHFGYPTLMKKMYENDGDELVKLLQKIKKSGATTSLDLSAVDPTSPAGKADWEKILSKALPFVDFFVPSFEELCYMLDRNKYDSLSKDKDLCTLITVADLKSLADKVHSLGAAFVLIKDGAAGMYYSCRKDPLFINGLELKSEEWSGISGFQKSYKPKNIKSATGAGDVAIAAFLSAVLQGRSLKECISLSAAAGSKSLESYDALSALVSLEELKKEIDSGWETQNLIEEK